MITYDDFAKIELKTARVLSAERVEGSEKLLALQVQLGDAERQILAGIGKSYAPEQLVGKTIIIVANLAPRSLMGRESQGMLLAADDGSGAVVLTVDRDVQSGSGIK